MSLFFEKLRAFAIHFVLTLAVAASAAAVIFFVWFPKPFDDMVGGTKLFILVTGCDLALGPLMSLVIYNSRKSKRELIADYSIVGVVQLVALIYGVYAVSLARPVYVAFAKDRIDVVTAREVSEADLAEARLPEYRVLPKSGPRLVGTVVNPGQENDALDGGLAGRDVSTRPKFFVKYDAVQSAVVAKAKPIDALISAHPESGALVNSKANELHREASELLWLPVKHTKGFWTALIDPKSGLPIGYLPVDPY